VVNLFGLRVTLPQGSPGASAAGAALWRATAAAVAGAPPNNELRRLLRTRVQGQTVLSLRLIPERSVSRKNHCPRFSPTGLCSDARLGC